MTKKRLGILMLVLAIVTPIICVHIGDRLSDSDIFFGLPLVSSVVGVMVGASLFVLFLGLAISYFRQHSKQKRISAKNMPKITDKAG